MSLLAQRLIEFLGDLHAMDHIKKVDSHEVTGVIDLVSGMIIEASPDYPDGEIFTIRHLNGHVSEVYACKLIDHLLVRHAQAMAIMEPQGGKPQDHYEHIQQHLVVKTGYGE